ncbi:hypothetical protein EAH79_04605 [Sphingomonas koreensis]|nr:hypothetical protein EAH79_04605 [Sphingomonas koreensis]
MPHRTAATLLAAVTLGLAGCNATPQTGKGSAQPAQPVDTATTAAVEPTPAPTAAVKSTPAPPPAAEPSRGSSEAAVAVVERYYDAIDRGDFRTAYAQWDRDGQASNQSFAQFQRGFAQTASVSVDAGAPTNGEGAAGSVFVDVPVTVHATLKDGTEQRFAGRYTLRRVNDVDGASAEQLRWHLDSAVLKAG